MSKSIRKILALVLSVMMLVSAIPVAVMAEDEVITITEGDFTYEIDVDEATLVGYNGTETDIEIPMEIADGAYTVTKLGSGANGNPVFHSNTEITSVKLPDSITEIPSGAFYGCTNLKFVDFGKGITKIGDTSFPLTKIETIIIGEKLKTVENNAFNGCTTLQQVNFRGTKAQWNAIEIDVGNDALKNANIAYNFGWDCQSDGCKLTLIEAVDPTCDTEGNIAYYLCEVCGNKTDVDGEPVDDVIIPESHDWSEATCTTPRTCALCGDTDGDNLGHKDDDDNGYCDVENCGVLLCNHENQGLTTKNAADATCEGTGYTGNQHCAKCDTVVVAGTVIDALGHNIIPHEAKVPTCTEGGWDAYETCSRCDYSTRGEDLPKNGHVEVRGQDIPATCTRNGFNDTVVCETCGITISEGETVPKLGHNMVKDEVRSYNSTCTMNGKLYMVCSREGCDYEEPPVELLLEDHEYINWRVTVEPTCTQQGIKASYCEGCGKLETGFVPATGHSYDYANAINNNDGTHTVSCTVCDEDTIGHEAIFECEYNKNVVASTCTQEGYTIYTCPICEYTYNDDVTDVLGHTYGNWTPNNDGTHSRECSVCEDEAGRIQTADCIYGEWTETVAPKCEEDGEKTRTCTDCGYVDTAAVDMLGHKDEDKDHVCDNDGCEVYQGTHEDTDNDHDCEYGCDETIGECVDADHDHECDYNCGATFGVCSDSADDDDHVCDYGCGEVLEECADGDDKNHDCDICGEENITEHTWEDADCVTPETCSHCEATRGEELGHDTIPHEAQDATCTEIGWEAYETCSRCDYTTYEEIEALGHRIIYVDAKDPSCTEVGWEDYEYCLRCDYSTYEEIEALGHEEEVIEGVAATCTEDGLEDGLYCSVCDTVLVEREVIDALGHDMVIDEENSKKVTCTEDGITVEKCSRCDEKSVTEIEKTGHKITNWVTSEEPTCTKDGVAIGRCTLCRFYTETKKIDKIPCFDENGDKKCDMCDKVIQTEKPEDTKPEDKPEEKPDCSCYCHTTGIIRFFLFDIPLLFQRFFGLNKTCKCGVAHY